MLIADECPPTTCDQIISDNTSVTFLKQKMEETFVY